METVILVSVLCTLGVVAMVTAVVVAFMKLNKKVEDRSNDTNHEFERVYEYIKEENNKVYRVIDDIHKSMNEQFRESYSSSEKEIDDVYRSMDERVGALKNDLMQNVNDIYQRMLQEDDDNRRLIDSRCDKLDSKIQGKLCKCGPVGKQLLTD